jgi:hypothetical protein
MALQSQGCAIYISTNATTGTTVTKLGELVSFNGPSGQAAVIDVTHLLSTAKERLIGLRDEGELSMTLNYSPSDTGQSAFITDRANRTKRKFIVKMSDTAAAETSHVIEMKGYCMGWSIAGAVDDKISANAVIAITGPASYTTWA